jgi:Asp-tRNA(Asn)/Glu-tRNA(Gln) amidotransferase A subunit family amidase
VNLPAHRAGLLMGLGILFYWGQTRGMGVSLRSEFVESIHYKSALELIKLIISRQISPLELMEETIKRIEAVNPILNAFVSLRAQQAMYEAKALTERLASGEEPGPLAGIPLGVKDLEDVKGMVTSFGSIPYKDNVVQRDSIQVARLKAAGAIVVGKTNTPEFGFTGFTKNRLYGVTRNPWNTERTPGGSSGGSAAGVAGGMVSMATGSDAGGSIRIPASYSGCYGLKTSFGRIPVTFAPFFHAHPGPFPFLQMHGFWTLGPLTRSVSDAALYLDCVAGYHPSDPDALPSPDQSFVKSLKNMPKDLRIAFSPTLGYAKVQKDVMIQVEEAVKCFEQMGHQVEIWEGTLPDVGETWSLLMNCELYAQLHQDLEGNREEMGRTLVKSLDQARSLSLEDQIEAQKVRTELNRIMGELFDQFDLLLTPTMPTEAFGAKGPPPSEIDGHPIPLLGALAFTYPFNLSGHPAASVPAGQTKNALPAGLQIIGPRQRDDLVLQASYAYEQMWPWNDHWPTQFAG